VPEKGGTFEATVDVTVVAGAGFVVVLVEMLVAGAVVAMVVGPAAGAVGELPQAASTASRGIAHRAIKRFLTGS